MGNGEEKDKEIRTLKAENIALKQQVSHLKNLISELTSKRYRKVSEAMLASPDQLNLFDETELTVNDEACRAAGGTATPTQVRSYVRHKARNTTFTVPADIAVFDEQVEVEAPCCDRCGTRMVPCGEKVFASLVKTVSFTLVRRFVPQFKCPTCEPDFGEKSLVTGRTGNMLEGTICHPLLLASIIVHKMDLALPLYRQEKELTVGDSTVSRQAMSAWMMKTGSILVRNLLPALQEDLSSCALINADETPVKILELYDNKGNKKAPNSKTNAFMMVRAGTRKDGTSGPVIFTFSDNRRNETLAHLFSSYDGVVQSDGLRGYAYASQHAPFTHLGCLVHARRKAVEAMGGKRTGPAWEIVGKYAALFQAEEALRAEYRKGTYPAEAYTKIRKKTLVPLLNDLKAKLTAVLTTAVPASKLYTACIYPLSRWDELTRFLEFPFATSSNQKAENAIRPFCVGKKNFLFCITADGADVSGMFYSLVETCKAMAINAEDYLAYLFMHAGLLEDGSEQWKMLLPGKCDISSVKRYKARLKTARPDPHRTKPYILRGKKP